MIHGSTQRSMVERMARMDPVSARRVAREIVEPWYRCQALAMTLVRHPDTPDAREVLQEAFDTALMQDEINRIVSVSAWPLGVLREWNDASALERETTRLLALNAQEESPVRRADALSVLLRCLVGGPFPIVDAVLTELERAAHTPLRSGKRNKKGMSELCSWAISVHPLAPERARGIIDHLTGPTLQRRARRKLGLPME